MKKILAALLLCGALSARVREVGPGKKYRTPCSAISAASKGDVIELDTAGKYDGDVCAFSIDNLTIRGVNGRARIDAGGQSAKDKGIWVIGGDNTTVENVEFSGAKSSSKNGAGIRLERGSLTLHNCYFHDNENGILTAADPAGEVLIEFSEFANNGFGDGYSHNMYIGHVRKFTLRYSYSHDARQGHLVKSRAAENQILYNRLSTETGETSYELDLPNGGTAYVIGNVIYQGPSSVNGGIMSYQEEGPNPDAAGSGLFVVNNTFVNARSSGSQFIAVREGMTPPPRIQNNVFSGPGRIANSKDARLAGNLESVSLADLPGFDFRLAPGSPAIDAGVNLPAQLRPAMEYLHPACAVVRPAVGPLDAGAFEFGGSRDLAKDAPERCRAYVK